MASSRNTIEMTYFGLFISNTVAIFVYVMLSYALNSTSDADNSNHYTPIKVIMTEKLIVSDTIYDTIYVKVPDQEAYNIGYFDGNSDAYFEFDSINNAYADND